MSEQKVDFKDIQSKFLTGILSYLSKQTLQLNK